MTPLFLSFSVRLAAGRSCWQSFRVLFLAVLLGICAPFPLKAREPECTGPVIRERISAPAPTPGESPVIWDTGSGSPKALRLSLQDAIYLALKRNQRIQVSSYNPRTALQDLKAAKAVYDPGVFSSATAGRVKKPTASLLDTGTLRESALLERKWFLRAGAKKFFPTGASLAIYQELDRLDSNSLYVIPDPQSTSRLVVEGSQPLLKGFGDRTNRALIQVARLNVAIITEEFRQTVMEVVAEVSKLYWQLVLEAEWEQISRINLERAEEIYRRERCGGKPGWPPDWPPWNCAGPNCSAPGRGKNP